MLVHLHSKDKNFAFVFLFPVFTHVAWQSFEQSWTSASVHSYREKCTYRSQSTNQNTSHIWQILWTYG